MTFKVIITFLFVVLIYAEQNIDINDKYLSWGIKNNLSISSYIEALPNEKNKIRFIAKTDIPKKTELLTIPNSIMVNISKVLKLINNKNLNKQYKDFSKLNLTYKPNPTDFRKEESFLSYILYLIQYKPNKFRKNKFYKEFQNYIESINKFSINSPLFYEQRQKEFLLGTYLGYAIDVLQKIYQDEIDIFHQNYNRYLDFEDYVHYRFYINNKGLNISNHWTLIPFLNYFDEDYTIYNANYTIEENGDVKIISRKKIKKGDEIILKSKKTNNIRRLLIEGKTNEKLENYFDEFYISAFSPGLYKIYNLTDMDLSKKYYINIKEKYWDSKITGIYLENADILNGDGTDTWAYTVLDSNMRYFKEFYEYINLAKIYEVFSDKNDRINIERIIKGEKKAIEKAYKQVNNMIDKFTNLQKQYLSGDKNSENVIYPEDLSDL